MTWKDLPRNPSTTTLRQFSAIWLVVFGVLGGLRIWHGQTFVGCLIVVAAVVGGIVGLTAPRLMRPIFVGWMIAVFPIGWLVSHVLMGIVYALLFVPLGIAFRLSGRDSLRVRRENRDTYWQPKASAADLASYYRQF